MPFVSFEGIDGSGKTEQVRRLVSHLRAIGADVLQTKEPDGGHLGLEVREILIRDKRQLSAAEQLLLVSAARYDHVRNVIAPALEKGRWVISDRFVDSTYAFQVASSDLDLEPLFEAATNIVVGAVVPDLTFILDIPVAVASARRFERGNEAADPSEALRDFEVIRCALLDLAHRNPRRCRVIDGDRPPELVAAEILRNVELLVP